MIGKALRAALALVAGGAALTGCVHRVPDVMSAISKPEQLRAPEGKALVVFVRPSNYPFGFYPVVMDEGGRFLADLHGAAFTALPVDSGKHDFIIYMENADLVRTNLGAGKVYVIQVFGYPGVMNPRFSMSAVRRGDENWPYPAPELAKLAANATGDVTEAQQILDSSGKGKAKIEDATKNFDDMSPADVRKHSLDPDDGVDVLCLSAPCAQTASVAAPAPSAAAAPAAPQASEECIPACRKGYACQGGQCVKARPSSTATPKPAPKTKPAPTAAAAPPPAAPECVPACRRGYVCDNGRCVAAAGVAPPAASPAEGPPAAEAEGPPALTHHPITTCARGKAVTIEARIVPSRGRQVFEPNVAVRVAGIEGYSRIPLKPVAGKPDMFSAVIPAAFTAADFDYFVEAFDDNGNGPSRQGAPDAPLHVTVQAAGEVATDVPRVTPEPSHPAPPLATTAEEAGSTSSRSAFGWSAIGLGAGGAVVTVIGIALGATASGMATNFNNAVASHQPYAASDYNAGVSTTTWGNVCIVGGVVLLAGAAAATLLWAVKGSSSSSSKPSEGQQ